MVGTFGKVRILAAGVVALLLASTAGTAFADAGHDHLELVGTTRDYLVVLRLGPGTEQIAPDATLNQIIFCGQPAGGVDSPEFARGVHHLEIHLLDRLTWRVIDTSSIAIAIEGKMDGLRQPLPAVKMVDPSIGSADLHYGSNIYMPDGRYRVDVEATGQPISFDFVVRGDAPEPLPGLWTVLVGRGVVTPLYLLFSAAAITVSLLVATGRWRPSSARLTRNFFAALLAFQAPHEIEHVVQVIQVYGLHQPRAAGLFGSIFAIEPIHLAYNGWFLALAVTVTAGYALWHRQELGLAKPLLGLLVVSTVLQTYHVLEHVVRVGQFLESGLNGTPGILGLSVELTWLHFLFNTITYTPFVLVFVLSGAVRPVAQELRGLFGGAASRRAALS